MPAEVYYQKNSQYSQVLKTHVLKSLLNKVAGHFIKKRLQDSYFTLNIGKFLKNLFWKTSAYGLFWRNFKKWLIWIFLLESNFQNHPGLVKLQKYQSLSNQNPL